jgi:hypothetical protein
MADETIPEESEGKPAQPDYLEALLYELMGFGLGVVLIVLAPQASEVSLGDAISEDLIVGTLFWIASRFGTPGGIVLCVVFLALTIRTVWKWRASKTTTEP